MLRFLGVLRENAEGLNIKTPKMKNLSKIFIRGCRGCRGPSTKKGGCRRGLAPDLSRERRRCPNGLQSFDWTTSPEAPVFCYPRLSTLNCASIDRRTSSTEKKTRRPIFLNGISRFACIPRSHRTEGRDNLSGNSSTKRASAPTREGDWLLF